MQSFFENLDMQLRGERGPNGEPSSYDFQSHELFKIVERFAEDWDRLTQQVWSLPVGDRGRLAKPNSSLRRNRKTWPLSDSSQNPPTCGAGRCEPPGETTPVSAKPNTWAQRDLNPRPSRCKRDALAN